MSTPRRRMLGWIGAFVFLALIGALAGRSVAGGGATVVRGPYLQSPTADSIVVRWRTDVDVDSRVYCGPAPGALSVCAESLTVSNEHTIELSGLNADTRYYYAIGSTTGVLAGDDASHWFQTSPTTGAVRPMRIWAIGDFGTANANQAAVRDAYETFSAGAHTDVWLMLGDSAYQNGTDPEYQAAVFDMYDDALKRSAPWPTMGNHDGSSSSSTESGPYFEIFTLPTNGEAGGYPSGTEAYYSFDYANVHFVVLNSFDVTRTPGSAMLTWLAADLDGTTQDFIVALWHHPPYSKGNHDSDVDPVQTEMRQYALPILEAHGVDLVLAGHSHSYERSYLIDGHYGTSDEFPRCDDAATPADPSDDFCAGDPVTACPGGPEDCDTSGFLIDAGDGRESPGDGAYGKSRLGPEPHTGTVYTVAGSAGQVPGGGSLDHPAMFVSLNVMGSLVLEIDGDRLDATFIDHTSGVPLDRFTIVKGLECPSGPHLDADGDEVCDDLDNCLTQSNADQLDSDLDGAGDVCDVCPDDADDDIDSDGVCGDVDLCPTTPDPDQLDADNDGVGDACDLCPADPDDDIDADGWCADVDNCPLVSNVDQIDQDSDALGDACDGCPLDPFNDIDEDDVCGDTDNCPETFNPCQIDSDLDTIGNLCETSEPSNCNAFVDQDSWIHEDDKNENYRNDPELDSESDNGNDRRPVLRFDLSAIPAGATIISATGWAYVLDDDEDELPVTIHRMTDDWTESDVTWDNSATDFDPAVAGSILPLMQDEWADFELTGLTQSWLDGTYVNQGVMLQSTSNNEKSKFASEERSGGSRSACLDVVYLCLTPNQDLDGDGVPDSIDGCPNDSNKADPGLCGCGQLDTDTDADGTADCDDACELDPNKVEPGACGCGTPDTDSDADGTADCLDACPDDPLDDSDNDGVCGDIDNCPIVANGTQANADSDEVGDACDPCPLDPADDIDADNVCADADNCATQANPDQTDADADGAGDACDPCPLDGDDDLDNDGICGEADNCPAAANTDQADTDGDGLGDACDLPGDSDGDGVQDGFDNCALAANPSQRDTDGDGSGDVCEDDDDGDGALDIADCAPLAGGVSSLPGAIGSSLRLRKQPVGTRLTWTRGEQGHVSHIYRGVLEIAVDPWHGELDCIDYATPETESIQSDEPLPGTMMYFVVTAANLCGTASMTPVGVATSRVPSLDCPMGEYDTDADGRADAEDNCALIANPDNADTDADFVGDLCDNCPTAPNADQADGDADGRGDLCQGLIDADNDGVEDAADNCPATFNTSQLDADADGAGDACDPCPDDPADPLTDGDQDGALDCVDDCPTDAGKTEPGFCGCGVSDLDTDADGTPDCNDACPLDALNDSDGDGVCDSSDVCPGEDDSIDGDGDGTPDPCDGCPTDASKTDPGFCGCDVSECWVSQTSATNENLEAVEFPLNATVGYVVGREGVIRKTVDGGATWLPQDAGSNIKLNSLSFPTDDQVGYAAGDEGLILKTIDGGANWTELNSGVSGGFKGIEFPVDSTVGYAVGGGGKIRKTIDAGASWQSQTSGTSENLEAVNFPTDTLTGFVSGRAGVLLKTIDGGATWSPLVSGVSTALKAIHFPTDSTTGYAAGDLGVVLRTTDGGATWTELVSGTTDGFKGAYFFDATSGYVVGNLGNMFKTFDSGANWTTQPNPAPDNLHEVIFVEGNSLGYAVGKLGVILKGYRD